MAKIRKVPTSKDEYQYHFVCPGCNEEHAFDNRWKFNQDFDSPTISPSYLMRFSHSSEANNKKALDFHKNKGRYPTLKELPYDTHEVCHSFIKNGKIQFLNDCTHKLKGQTVELPNIKHP